MLKNKARRAGMGVLLLVALFLAAFSTRGFDPGEAERELVVLTNSDRTSNGVPSLLIDERLMEVARYRSQDMATRNYFAHEIPPQGYYFNVYLEQRGIRYLKVGENLARNNYPTDQSVYIAESDWLGSPSHRRNILDPDFDHLGTGAALATEDFKIYTVIFLQSPPLQPTPTPLPPSPTPTLIPTATATATAMPSPSPTTTPLPGQEISRLPAVNAGLIQEIINRILSLFLNFR